MPAALPVRRGYVKLTAVFAEWMPARVRPAFRLLPLPFCIAMSLSAYAADDENDWGLCPIEPAVPVFADAQAPTSAAASARTTSPTDIEGDSLDGVEGQTLNYNGNVALRRGDQFLGTDKLVYDTETNKYVADGNVRYQDSGMRLVAEHAEGDQNLDAHKIDKVRYQLISRRGNGGADRIEMKGAQGALYGSTYTTCPPDQVGWSLNAPRIDVDTDAGFGTAHNATLRVGKVPVLWVPYIKFPIDERRQTGLLYPSIALSGRNGFDWRQPIYLNLAPNYDATLIPRLMTKRGLQLGGQFRYLTESGGGTLDAAYLPSDDLTDREHDQEIADGVLPENRRDDNRGIFRFKGFQNFDSHWRAVANLNWISDPRYLEDFSNSLNGISNYSLLSDIGVYGRGRYWDAGIVADHNQLADYTLNESVLPYDRLPRAFAHWEQPFATWFTAGVDTEAVRFQHVGDETVRPGGSRFDVKPFVSFPIEGASWYVTPTLAYRYTAYRLDNTTTFPERSPTRSLPITTVDAGLFFDRQTSFGGAPYLQTLEPRLFYLKAPYRDQTGLPLFDTQPLTFSWGQLFRDNRFSGADRQADANELTLALTSRLIRESDGREKLSASIGQIHYFDDSLVTSDRTCATPGDLSCPGTIERGKSAWITDATYAINDRWTVNASYQWDPKARKDDLISVRTRYLIGDDGIVNFAYRYRRNPNPLAPESDLLKQVDFSFLYPLTPAWSLVGRYYYSLKDHQLLEGIAGVQWDSCCVAVRLVGRRYVRNRVGDLNSAIQLEIELKGLGSAGPDTESRLRRAILGYQREDLYLVPPPEARSGDDTLSPDSSSPDSTP